MIIYLDTSALLKLTIQENMSGQVGSLIQAASSLGASALTLVEMAAALAKALRVNSIRQEEAQAAWEYFLADWPSLTRLHVSPPLIEKAARLAWEYNLRGYDALHLASALFWQEALSSAITLATFDRELWQAGQKAGLAAWPDHV